MEARIRAHPSGVTADWLWIRTGCTKGSNCRVCRLLLHDAHRLTTVASLNHCSGKYSRSISVLDCSVSRPVVCLGTLGLCSRASVLLVCQYHRPNGLPVPRRSRSTIWGITLHVLESQAVRKLIAVKVWQFLMRVFTPHRTAWLSLLTVLSDSEVVGRA